jgi:TPR repeat protein
MQFNGMGCDRDPQAAFSLLEKAVALGSGQAGALLRSWKVEEAERMK